MNNLLKYIEEAVEAGIDRVKIVVNGFVTEGDARTALIELRKPKIARKGYWSFTEPFVAGIHDEKFVEAVVVEEKEIELVEPIEEETSKKKKKTSEQSNES
jgi:hypothetical protein